MAEDRENRLEEQPANRERRAALAHMWRATRRPLIIVVLALALVVTVATVPHSTLTRLLDGLLIRRSLAAMLLVFGLLGLSLLWSDGQSLDAAVFLRINVHGPHPRFLDRAMGLATQLGNVTTAAVLAELAFLAGNRRLAVEIALGVISLWLIVETIKALADRTRPYRVFAQTRIVGWRAVGPSFPSGHTSQAFFLASLLAHHYQFNLWLTALLYGLATLVGFTRMYVGAHYPRDVMGGMIAGWVWGVLATLADQGLARR
jgi:membrane-associated phospholipid phosphatase